MSHRTVTDVRRAVEALLAWEGTAELTGSSRHEAVAATCQQIAVERARHAMETGLSDAERALLRVIELDAMTRTRIETSRAAIARTLAHLEETSRAAIAKSLALLEASEPAAPGPDVLTWIPSQAAE
jgi:hypothetical protein